MKLIQLGKTIQTIAFMGWLQYVQGIHGPFLVVVPLSTLANWENEIKKWLPDTNVVVYSGMFGVLMGFAFFVCLFSC
jgi:chromodomain-helicase-DNA-binding protein 1